MKTLLDFKIMDDAKSTKINKKYFCILEEDKLVGFKYETEIISKCDYDERQKERPFVTPIINSIDLNKSISQEKHFERDNILILFVKADTGFQLLDHIQTQKMLSPDLAEDLYLQTMNLWVGSTTSFEEQIYGDFELPEARGSIPKLDYQLLQFNLNNKYSGYKKNEQDGRMLFFEAICKDELPLIRISKRLNFGKGQASKYAWEK